MNPEEFIRDMQDFFTEEFPEFKLFIPEPGSRKSVSFFASYQRANISIVIYPSIRIQNGKKVFAEGRIKVMVFNTEKRYRLFWLKHTNRKNWQNSVRDKVNALKLLVEDIEPCEKCGSLPSIQRSFTKKDGKGTKFISLYCNNCKEYKSTTYGTYLKTLLHKHLK